MLRPALARPSRRARSVMHVGGLAAVYVGVLAAIASLCVGCAGAPMAGSFADAPSATTASAAMATLPTTTTLVELVPVGPGGVFPSAEAAALDALAYAHLQSRAVAIGLRRARGGAIHAIAGGFTYDEPTVASRGATARLRYPLDATDPAHYIHHPARPRAVSSVVATRALDAAARQVVEQGDAAGRPLFYMTPRRHVRVVEAGQPEPRSLARVEFSARRRQAGLTLALPADGAAELASSLAALPSAR